mmetsp:Transcript_24699/g.59547  ORF Transcript_24699/g.59547 Transcript_24699/m.59547 type:complete len:141 (-) Transcript_24699:76-498(-)
MMALGEYYVSVTGLLPKSVFSMPKFLYLASRAYQDILKAEGNVYSCMFTRDGVQHTITVWESKEAMRKFMGGKAHVNAVNSLKDVSRYAKIHGYFTDERPTATEAISEWKKDGKRVYGEPRVKCGDLTPVPCWQCKLFEQ